MVEEPQNQDNNLNDNVDDFNKEEPMVESDFSNIADRSAGGEVEANTTEDVVSKDTNPELTGEQAPSIDNISEQTTTPVFPIKPQNDVMQAGVEKKKPRFSKKMISLVVAGAVVLLSGATAFAAFSWYQAPEKVLTDSLFNVIKSKSVNYTGDVSYSSGDYKLTLSINGKSAKSVGDVDIDASISVGGKDYSVLASGMIVDSGDLYFKVGGLKELAGELKSAIGEYGDIYSDPIDKLVTKINDKWIKISSSDLASFNKDYSDTEKCVSAAIDKYMDDDKALNEVFDVYDKNKFIVIDKELGQKDGSYGYEIKGDKEALAPFIEGLRETAIYKSLKDCDSSFELNPSDFGVNDVSNNTSTGVLEVWVDGWSHQITKISATGKDSSDSSELSVLINPVFNKEVSVEAPSEYMTIDEIKTFITNLLSA